MLKLAALINAFLAFLAAFNGFFTGSANKNTAADTIVNPGSWAMTDSLGRTLDSYGEIGETDNKKFVGLFYWTWHTQWSYNYRARNVTELLKTNPAAVRDWASPLWEGLSDGYPHYWNEPLYGYYSDADRWVLRRQAELLADAGVDVIFFDCTNGAQLFEESYEVLFEVFELAKKDGIAAPQVAFLLPFSDSDGFVTTDLRNLYENIYKPGRYKDLWFMWDGKPLVLAAPDTSKINDVEMLEILSFFTFRDNDPSYFSDDTLYASKTWGWCSDYPQTKYGIALDGSIEQMCVSVAQNAFNDKLVAMNNADGAQGRAFSKGNYSYSYSYAGETVTVSSDSENAYLYGVNFQQQWDYAIEQNPDFIFVTGWNEWIAGRWQEWCGTENAFPDQFNDEYSRDCEPSKGILKDNYYCQLCANIRRFKGTDSSVNEKNGVKNYYSYSNSIPVRSCNGWDGIYYTSDTVINDFVSASVYDEDGNIFFTLCTKSKAVLPDNDTGIRIFLDTDQSGCSPNFEGFEYVVTIKPGDKKASIERYCAEGEKAFVAYADYKFSSNTIKINLPAETLGLSEDNIHFNFKLSDNMQNTCDILDFYLNGDVAPGGRYTFVY